MSESVFTLQDPAHFIWLLVNTCNRDNRKLEEHTFQLLSSFMNIKIEICPKELHMSLLCHDSAVFKANLLFSKM